MRFVPDTNILISAFFWGGLPAKVLELAQRPDCTLVSSEGVLAELLAVLQREKFADRLQLINKTPAQFLQNYRALVEMVEVTPLPQPVCDDPDDDAVLACAISGGADVIVSGDDHLLRLDGYAGIQVIKPAEFLSRFKDQ
jgi:putative PIN family toxin of toxin-antitoxin system